MLVLGPSLPSQGGTGHLTTNGWQPGGPRKAQRLPASVRQPLRSRLMRIFVRSIARLWSSDLGGGPLEDAHAAYRKQDYATALRLYRPLADGLCGGEEQKT